MDEMVDTGTCPQRRRSGRRALANGQMRPYQSLAYNHISIPNLGGCNYCQPEELNQTKFEMPPSLDTLALWV